MANLSVLMPILTFAGIALLIIVGIAALFKAFYFKVDEVSFTINAVPCSTLK